MTFVFSFTIPHTKYTKAVCVGISNHGAIVAFIWETNAYTPGDEIHFFNAHGYSKHVAGGVL